MRKALGKGIDALISRVETENGETATVSKIPLSTIVPNRHQPRKRFGDESMTELALSIKKHGLAQPIIVFRKGEKYEIIAGERRWRASKLAGLEEIDAIVRERANDEETLALSLIENIQREDLNPVDEAMAYKKLIDFGISQTKLAEYCGKSKSAVSNALRILELEDEIKDALQSNIISGGHARALLAIPSTEKRKRAYHQIITERWSVRDIENFSRKTSPRASSGRAKSQKDPDTANMELELEKRLGTKIEIKKGDSPENGKIIISFYSLNDFNRIYSLLAK